MMRDFGQNVRLSSRSWKADFDSQLLDKLALFDTNEVLAKPHCCGNLSSGER